MSGDVERPQVRFPRYEKSPPALVEVQTTKINKSQLNRKINDGSNHESQFSTQGPKTRLKSRAPPKTPTVQRGQVIQRSHDIQRRPPTRVAVQPRRYARGAGVQKGTNAVEYIFDFKRELPVPKQSGPVDSVPRPGSERHLANPSRQISEKVFLPSRGYSTACPITVGRRRPKGRQ